MTNTLIDEVRAARAALAEEHGYDRKKVYEWARKAHEARKQSRQEPEPEQSGTGQPATRPTVGPEGGDKPQPEAEGPSR